MIPWCSGYHVSLTHSRSPVRSRAESTFFFYFCTCLDILSTNLHVTVQSEVGLLFNSIRIQLTVDRYTILVRDYLN